jgi:hypothetical protein
VVDEDEEGLLDEVGMGEGGMGREGVIMRMV